MSFRIGNKKIKNTNKIEEFDTDLDSILSLFYNISKKSEKENIIPNLIPLEKNLKDLKEDTKIDEKIILNSMEKYIKEISQEKICIDFFPLEISTDKISFINIKIESNEELFYNYNFDINNIIELNLNKLYKNTFLEIKPIGTNIQINKINFYSTNL